MCERPRGTLAPAQLANLPAGRVVVTDLTQVLGTAQPVSAKRIATTLRDLAARA